MSVKTRFEPFKSRMDLILSKIFVHRIVLPVGFLYMSELLPQVLQSFHVVFQLQIVFTHFYIEVEFNPHDALLAWWQLLISLSRCFYRR